MPTINYDTHKNIISILERIARRINSNEAKFVLQQLKKADWRIQNDKAYLLVAFIPDDASLNTLLDLLPKVQASLNDLSDNRPPIVSVHPEKGTRLFMFKSNKASNTIWDTIRLNLHGSGINIFLTEVGSPVTHSCFSEDGWRKICKMTSLDQ